MVHVVRRRASARLCRNDSGHRRRQHRLRRYADALRRHLADPEGFSKRVLAQQRPTDRSKVDLTWVMDIADGYEIWNEAIAHVAIITDPQHRGRGHGRAAVALAAESALDAGLIPQYRTLKSNAPSMAIARKLGLREYGFSVYVRLRG